MRKLEKKYFHYCMYVRTYLKITVTSDSEREKRKVNNKGRFQ